MKKDIEEVFENLLSRYCRAMEYLIKTSVQRSRDKEYMEAEIKSRIEFMLSWERSDQNKANLYDLFTQAYKQGEDIGKTLIYIQKHYGQDVEDELSYTVTDEQGVSTTVHFDLPEENKALKQIILNDSKIIKFFVRHIAYLNLQKRFTDIFTLSPQAETRLASPHLLKWTTPIPSKDNKNEFVQLIYGLYSAGFINNGKGEITKIVEAAAEVFEVNLGKNWQSNHSASIHKAKRDYQPLIFHKIREAYQQYTDKQVEGKRK